MYVCVFLLLSQLKYFPLITVCHWTNCTKVVYNLLLVFFFLLLAAVNLVTPSFLARDGAPSSDILQTFYTTLSHTLTYSLFLSLSLSAPPYMVPTQQVKLFCTLDLVKRRRHQAWKTMCPARFWELAEIQIHWKKINNWKIAQIR